MVDAHVAELTVAAVLELEGKRDERRAGVGRERHLLLVLVQVNGVVHDLVRSGQVRVHAVEQELHALVLVGRAHHDGGDLQRDRAATNGGLDELRRDLLLEDGLGELVVVERERVEHVGVPLVSVRLHVVGNVLGDHVVAVGARDVNRLHVDEVDEALELVLEADRQLQEHGVQVQLLFELILRLEGVRARAVELVDEDDARDAVAAHLTVDRERLRLHTGDAAEHENRAVEHAERALHLDGEVDVAGRVDDVDVVALPEAVRRSRLDGDAAFALEIHRVHLRADTVLALHLVNGVDALGVIEDALGEGGFARVDVSTDPDVTDLREVHGSCLLL